MEKREYCISKAKGEVPLASRWNDECWKNIPELTLDFEQVIPGRSSGFRPDSRAKLQYDENYIYVLYKVEDQYVKGSFKNDQEMVCLDSTMEFFVRPNGNGCYYNFECNCIGTLLLYEITADIKMTHLPLEELAQVKRSSTLPRDLQGELSEPTTWQLQLQIPLELFIRRHGVTLPLSGQIWTGNVFKCADATSHPHWLLWNNARDFHVPEDFGYFRFE